MRPTYCQYSLKRLLRIFAWLLFVSLPLSEASALFGYFEGAQESAQVDPSQLNAEIERASDFKNCLNENCHGPLCDLAKQDLFKQVGPFMLTGGCPQTAEKVSMENLLEGTEYCQCAQQFEGLFNSDDVLEEYNNFIKQAHYEATLSNIDKVREDAKIAAYLNVHGDGDLPRSCSDLFMKPKLAETMERKGCQGQISEIKEGVQRTLMSNNAETSNDEVFDFSSGTKHFFDLDGKDGSSLRQGTRTQYTETDNGGRSAIRHNSRVRTNINNLDERCQGHMEQMKKLCISDEMTPPGTLDIKYGQLYDDSLKAQYAICKKAAATAEADGVLADSEEVFSEETLSHYLNKGLTDYGDVSSLVKRYRDEKKHYSMERERLREQAREIFDEMNAETDDQPSGENPRREEAEEYAQRAEEERGTVESSETSDERDRQTMPGDDLLLSGILPFDVSVSDTYDFETSGDVLDAAEKGDISTDQATEILVGGGGNQVSSDTPGRDPHPETPQEELVRWENQAAGTTENTRRDRQPASSSEVEDSNPEEEVEPVDMESIPDRRSTSAREGQRQGEETEPSNLANNNQENGNQGASQRRGMARDGQENSYGEMQFQGIDDRELDDVDQIQGMFNPRTENNDDRSGGSYPDSSQGYSPSSSPGYDTSNSQEMQQRQLQEMENLIAQYRSMIEQNENRSEGDSQGELSEEDGEQSEAIASLRESLEELKAEKSELEKEVENLREEREGEEQEAREREQSVANTASQRPEPTPRASSTPEASTNARNRPSNTGSFGRPDIQRPSETTAPQATESPQTSSSDDPPSSEVSETETTAGTVTSEQGNSTSSGASASRATASRGEAQGSVEMNGSGSSNTPALRSQLGQNASSAGGSEEYLSLLETQTQIQDSEFRSMSEDFFIDYYREHGNQPLVVKSDRSEETSEDKEYEYYLPRREGEKVSYVKVNRDKLREAMERQREAQSEAAPSGVQEVEREGLIHRHQRLIGIFNDALSRGDSSGQSD